MDKKFEFCISSEFFRVDKASIWRNQIALLLYSQMEYTECYQVKLATFSQAYQLKALQFVPLYPFVI